MLLLALTLTITVSALAQRGIVIGWTSSKILEEVPYSKYSWAVSNNTPILKLSVGRAGWACAISNDLCVAQTVYCKDEIEAYQWYLLIKPMIDNHILLATSKSTWTGIYTTDSYGAIYMDVSSWYDRDGIGVFWEYKLRI